MIHRRCAPSQADGTDVHAQRSYSGRRDSALLVMQVPLTTYQRGIMVARAFFLLGALLLFAPATPSRGQSASNPERATFLLQRQGVSLGAEHFTRTAERLGGEVHLATGQRARYTAQLGEGATVTRFEAKIFAPGTPEGGAPARAFVITFKGDTAVAEISAGDQT